MTNQETFDFVYKKIVEQGGGSFVLQSGYPLGQKPAGTPVSCSYRGPGGRRCAAGWLMPDEEYQKDWEGNRVYSLRPETTYDGVKVTLGGADFDFADRLQRIHDNAVTHSHDDGSFLHIFRKKMIVFANSNALNTNAIEAA